MEEIYSRVPCRDKQLNALFELLGDRYHPLPWSIFISGTMATGKSLCVDLVLKYLDCRTVTVNCIECYTPKVMYENILSGLGKHDADVRCDTMLDLVNGLNRYQLVYDPIVLVFDRAERLRNMDHTIIPALISLREHCKQLNICTVFITHLVYFDFQSKIGAREPIQLYFDNYNKEELFKIIFLQQKTFIQYLLTKYEVEEDIKMELKKPQLFANFLNAFLSVFYRPCRYLIELQYMARTIFVKYCEPIIRKEIQADDLTKLWRHISPIMKSSLKHLYLRLSSTKAINSFPGKEKHNSKTQSNLEDTLKDKLISTKTFVQSFELPYYAKYLLIASYLASYNPPKEDKRIFMKNQGKQCKSVQQIRAKAKIAEKLNTQLGPKIFTFNRLMAIFFAILDHKLGVTGKLLAQISTLVELKLLAGSKEIELDEPKYKCLVGNDFITAVAQTVGFNLKKYLYDFM